MNVSYQWLRALAPTIEGDAQQVADRLAQLGAPADAVVPLGAGLGDIVSARVVSARKHPNADKLTLTEVDAGTGTLLQVVCGAPNVEAGKTYAFAPVGAQLPGGLVIRKAKIRGETSEGMLCSERELGLGRDHTGIWALPGDPQPGLSLIEIAGLDDTRLELDIGPNRPDLLSHAGIAAELAPHGRSAVALPAVPGERDAGGLEPVASAHSVEVGGVTITIEDDGCRRYLAAIIRGVAIGPSPAWLVARLRAVGLRSINNVVDATNYVLYELGQPLHAFDFDRLRGPAIVVRESRAGEKLTTLDGAERALPGRTIVIGDAERAVALGGVMGGSDSEVTDATRNVLLECALFDPKRVRATRRALGMSTDASHRYERGVDAHGLERALRRCVSIIVATAGGTPERAFADVTRSAPAERTLEVRASRVRQVLGVDIDAHTIADVLSPIGFDVEVVPGDVARVRVPGARLYDVEREIDLIEEVARRYGYERFPDEARPFRATTVPDDPIARMEDRLRDRMVGRGFMESRTVPFAPESDGDLALALPLSAEESRLRRALLPGLLRRAEHNWARGVDDLRLFEIGTGFGAAIGAAEPAETRRLALLFTGRRAPAHWSGSGDVFDLWDLKGLLEELAPALGGAVVRAVSGGPTFLGPEVFEVTDASGRTIGYGGRANENVIDKPARIGAPLWAAELLVEARTADSVLYAPIPVHPAVERDLALIEKGSASAGAIDASIRAAAGELLEDVQPFDVFRGGSLPDGARSIAFRLRFRAPGRTLTDDEVDRAVEKVLRALKEEHGIERR